MAQPVLFDLDWRSGPKSSEIEQRLTATIARLDSQAEVDFVISSDSNQQLVRIHPATRVIPRMFRQEKRTVARRLPAQDGKISQNNKYMLHMFYLVQELVRRVVGRSTTYHRSLVYEIAIPKSGLTPEKTATMINDLALTIGVHPSCLGLKAEHKSYFFVPYQTALTLDQVDNIFDYLDDHNQITRQTLSCGTYVVPGLIRNLDIINKGTAIRAVVVTEHRNLQSIIPKMKGPGAIAGFQGVMLVMTGGYADFAVREFLCLLAKALAHRNVPFIWDSDGDVAGATIYGQLRCNSRSAAWASPIMVCPQLRFGGINMRIFDGRVASYPQRHLEIVRYRREKEGMSAFTAAQEAQRIQEAKDWVTNKANLVKSSTLGREELVAQKAKCRQLRDGNYFEAGKDDVVLELLDALENGQVGLRLSSLNTINVHEQAYFVRDSVAAAHNEEYQDLPVVYRMASLRAALNTQSQPQEPAAAVQGEEEEEELDDELLVEEYI